MAGITITDVSKSYGGNAEGAAVSGLSLEIRDNTFVTLLGPSGCGKTTTLRLIAGVPRAGYGDHPGRLPAGFIARQCRAAGAARHGDGVPELRGMAA